MVFVAAVVVEETDSRNVRTQYTPSTFPEQNNSN